VDPGKANGLDADGNGEGGNRVVRKKKPERPEKEPSLIKNPGGKIQNEKKGTQDLKNRGKDSGHKNKTSQLGGDSKECTEKKGWSS